MNWEEIIIDYYNGELESGQEKLLMQKIQEDATVKNLYDDFGMLYSDMDEESMSYPSTEMTSRFENFIEEEKKKSEPIIRKLPLRFMAYAASILLLISVGVVIGLNYANNKNIERQNQELVQQFRQEMKDMINDNSVSNRITAVNVAYKSQEADPEMVDILIQTLKNDESPNVRLAAVEALAEMGPSQLISQAFKMHMDIEEDDFVKIAIIHAFGKIKDENAVYTLEKITQDEEVPKFIKDEAHIAQIQLNKI